MFSGLTKREMMAMHMMASLTRVYWDTIQEYETGADLVKCQSETAVEMVDALLEELAVCEDLDGLKIDDSFRNKFPDYFE